MSTARTLVLPRPTLMPAILLALAVAALLAAPVDARGPGLPGDPDGDGLSNTEERFWGSDPKDADTDNDGLDDYEEVTAYHTDPTRPDSDDDGLTDLFEVTVSGTLPYDADTDDDGVLDGEDAYPTHPHRD